MAKERSSFVYIGKLGKRSLFFVSANFFSLLDFVVSIYLLMDGVLRAAVSSSVNSGGFVFGGRVLYLSGEGPSPCGSSCIIIVSILP